MPESSSLSLKDCFVISPIGEPGSATRRRADQVLNHIIRPVARQCGYHATRADEISKPGVITSQIIQRIIDDPLVIADLTERNANVFYELAVRHVVRKPIIKLIDEGETIPFDVAQSRTIPVNIHDLDSVENCKQELRRQIEYAATNPLDAENPITTTLDLQSLRQSGDPAADQIAKLAEITQSLNASVQALAARVNSNDRLNDLLMAQFGADAAKQLRNKLLHRSFSAAELKHALRVAVTSASGPVLPPTLDDRVSPPPEPRSTEPPPSIE